MSGETGALAAQRQGGGIALQRAAPTQQRLWLLAQLHPDSWIYNITSSIELRGELDLQALRRAAADLYGRHEALRMTFQQVGSQVHQQLLEATEPQLEVVDLAQRQQPRQLADRRVAAVAKTPMDLSQGPLFKLLLCRLGPRSQMLTLFVHHIVADAWSVGIMWEELGALYSRHRGATVELEPLQLSYREYAQEEWRRAETPEAAAELGRWLQRLEGVDTDNSLRSDRRRPAAPSFRGATIELGVPADLARRLRERARALRGTPFMVLLAGFAASLAQYDRKREVVIATQVAGRSDHRVARTVGFFVNTLPLRFDLDPEASLEDLVRQARELALEAYGTEHVTFEQLLQEVGSLGDRSMNPLTQVAFQLLNVPIPDVEFGDLESKRWWDTSRGAKFDLGVMLVPEPDGGFRGFVTYAADLFEPATIHSLWHAYLRLLEAIAGEPDRRLRELELVDREQAAAIAAWSRGPAPDPAQSADLLDRLAGWAGQPQPGVALRLAEGDLTYAELWQSAGRVATALLAAGVEPEEVVAVACGSRAETIRAIVGCWRAGATPMTIEAAFSSTRLLELAAELGTRVGIGEEIAVAGSAGIHWLPFAATQASAAEPPARPVPRDAYIVTTSGTTGRPRAVAARMAAFGTFVARAAAGLSPPQAVLQVPPLGFDPGMRDSFTTLAAGTELLLPEQIDANPIDAIADALAAGAADSILAIVPSLLDGVLNELAARRAEVCLRELHCCGEALPRALAARAARAFGCVPVNDYGSSECTMVSVSSRQDPEQGETAIMPLGSPMPGVEAWVLGAGGQLLPAGFTGEIHVAGTHLTAGYLGDPAATAERFVPHPQGPPGALAHRTGDLGYFDEAGVLHWVGRLDRQVKVRGVRIELAAVEAALLAVPGVRDAAVVPTGDGPGTRLAAYLVAAEERPPEALRERLRGVLPRASVPSSFQFVAAIPRSRRGKLQRDLLPAPALAAAQQRQPLAGPVEETVAAVWEQVLGAAELPLPAQLGADDDFFELGGDSLAALQMASRVASQTGCRLSIGDVFDYPTIGELAAHVTALASA